MVTSRASQRRHAERAAEGRDLFLAWAREVLRTAKFASEHQRRIWELYAAGKSISEICAVLEPRHVVTKRRGRFAGTRLQAVGTSRRSVTLALDRVRNMVPLAPVTNPWRKSGRSSTALKGEALAAMVRKVTAKLRRISADERELQRLLEAHMGKDGMQKYKAIKLNRDMTVPGIATAKNILIDVDGRPHAGGIDVTMKTSRAGKDGMTRITVPWHAIKQAEVEVGEDAGA